MESETRGWGIRGCQKHENLSLITAFVITHLGILNLTPDNYLLTAYAYVAFRSQNPDQTTLKDVLKELQNVDIDVNQLVEYRTDHCQ
jgi:hypothetical protein